MRLYSNYVHTLHTVFFKSILYPCDFEHDSYFPHVSSLMWLDIYFDDGDPPLGNTRYGKLPQVPSIQESLGSNRPEVGTVGHWFGPPIEP